MLVYRPGLDRWYRSFPVPEIENDTCTVLLPPPTGTKMFGTTVFKRFIPDEDSQNFTETNVSDVNSMSTDAEGSTPKVLTSTIQSAGNISDDKLHYVVSNELMIYATKMSPQSNNHKKYASSSTMAINGFIQRGLFMLKTPNDIGRHRIYVSSFVNCVKHGRAQEANEKFGFIIESFDDQHDFLTHTPAVTHSLQRLLLSTNRQMKISK